MSISPEFLLQTKSVWQKWSSTPLNQEDCRVMVDNAAGFFGVLNEWQAAIGNKNDKLPNSKSSAVS
ncbi:hypothetical protein [Legionella sp. km772]|uniref:hypothetical protein n=1 Tax=Legionella sp. km772 TaxID=2498111 RepID=UPI000F8C7B0F|nr:hypothetical protein [Legionella sp. km772]RUR13504.1 hypothetical protein ELY15_02030 [Legionella sp. km772]